MDRQGLGGKRPGGGSWISQELSWLVSFMPLICLYSHMANLYCAYFYRGWEVKFREAAGVLSHGSEVTDSGLQWSNRLL